MRIMAGLLWLAGWKAAGGEAVVAVRAEPFDAGEFGERRRAAAGEHGDEVDGLGDQRARDGDDGFLDELLQAAQRAERGAGVDGADAAGMAGAPGFEEVERFGAAHLADRDAVGAQAQRGADEIGERRDAVLGPHGDEVGRGALQLARVLDQTTRSEVFATSASSALVSVVLPVEVPPATRMLRARRRRLAQRLGLIGRHDPGRDIVVEREHRDGGLADREGRRRDDGRQQALEPLAPFSGSSAETRGAPA
jgi:hypothetical protein